MQVCLRHCTPLAVQRLLESVARGASALARVRHIASQVPIALYRAELVCPDLILFLFSCLWCLFLDGARDSSFSGAVCTACLLQALESLCGSVVEAFGSALFEVRAFVIYDLICCPMYVCQFQRINRVFYLVH